MGLLLLLATLVAAVSAGPARFAADAGLLPRDCNANNCLRAVRNTKSLASHSADCVSFFEYTVTPATV